MYLSNRIYTLPHTSLSDNRILVLSRFTANAIKINIAMTTTIQPYLRVILHGVVRKSIDFRRHDYVILRQV